MARNEIPTDLVALRSAAVKLLDTVEDCCLADGLLPSRSTEAWTACLEVGDVLHDFDEALSKLQPWSDVSKDYEACFVLPDSKETADSHRACRLFREALWNLSCAGFEKSYDVGEAVPAKVDADIIKKLKHGIRLLERFGPEKPAKTRKRGTKAAKSRKIDVAITIKTREPWLSEADVAKRAHCDPSYLSRNEEYKKMAALAERALDRQRKAGEYDKRTGQHHAVDDHDHVAEVDTRLDAES